MEFKNSLTPEVKRATTHGFKFDERQNGFISGVQKVVGASGTTLNLVTVKGDLVITGKDLKIVKYDEADGNLSFTGDIDSFKYSGAKVPLLKRLFK